MAATTRKDFGADTEAVDVAKEFAPQIRGKTVLVTGVNREGIGFKTSQAIASQSPALLILTGRNEQKLKECIDALTADFSGVNYRPLQMDLSDQQSVRDAASEVLTWADVPVVDIVINNAAVMGVQERTLTKDGIELHFATNHLGHWLFTCLIMPKLFEATENSPKGATRVVNVSSLSPTLSSMRWSDINFDQQNKDLPEAEKPNFDWFAGWGYKNAENMKYVPLDGYDRSKVANVLFGIGLNKRLYDTHGIFSLAVHPGIIGSTELGRHFPPETIESIKTLLGSGQFSRKTAGAGGSTSMVAALDPKLAKGVGESRDGSENYGIYLIDCQISDRASTYATSSAEAEKLWELSETLVGQTFSW